MSTVDQPEDSDKAIPATDRLAALAQAALGLGQAIRGCGELGSTALPQLLTLTEQLLMITKRLSWIEKQGDPDWKPFEARPGFPDKAEKRG